MPDILVPLRIRHLAVAGRDDHPSAANGVHGVARQMVREQRAAGHDARLILLASGPAMHAESEAERAISIVGQSIGGRTIRLRRSCIDAVLAEAGPGTVFHIHGGREPLLNGLTRRMRREGLPYAITVHGRYSHVYDRSGVCLKRSTALYLRWVEREMLTRARFVQALSEAEAQILRAVAPEASIVVVGNGAYSSRISLAAPPAPRNPSAHYPHFVFCGRYAIHHKGLDLLLEGFALYRRAGGAGRLSLMGTGPARATLQVMAAELGLKEVVTIDGPRFGADREWALRDCDYFVMVSRYEGLPLAALEAAAAGLPLLMTRETGLGDTVGQYSAGIAIEALSADAVQAALGEASAQSAAQWVQQRIAAHRMTVALADWTAIARRLCALYGGSAKASPAGLVSTTSL